jgi:hypothetical protein
MIKQFLTSSLQWVPQAGFSIEYTENAGIQATQDVLVRNSDFRTGSALVAFVRGVRWEVIFPDVPPIYSGLTLQKFNPKDRGDGYSLISCVFTGYQLTAEGTTNEEEEEEQPTSSLEGQLIAEPLSTHPKFQALDATAKVVLGYLIGGEYVWDSAASKIKIVISDGSLQIDETLSAYITGNAIIFAKMIAEGNDTWERGGWTYNYQTESSKGFTPTQLNKLGKIVPNPPGNPTKPPGNWTWLLASPNQSQQGLDRFRKTLNFKLIQDNAINQFLYE